MLKTAKEVEQWVTAHGTFTSAPGIVHVDPQTLEVDLDGDYYLHPAVQSLPVAFRRINGSFSCVGAGLATLSGCPQEVDGHFDCRANPLVSYEHAPGRVGRLFVCDGTRKVLMLLYSTRMEFLVCWRNKPLAQALRRHWKGFLSETSPRRAVMWLQQRLIEDLPPPLDDEFGTLDW